MKKKNNSGFSLVELLIVIAVIAVISAISAVSISYYSSQNQKQAKNNVVSFMGKVQTYSMAKKSDIFLFIKATSGDITLESGVLDQSTVGTGTTAYDMNLEKYKIPSKVPFTVVTSTGSYDLRSENHYFLVGFDRSTGAFSSVTVDGNDAGEISSINMGSETVTVVWKTGKIF